MQLEKETKVSKNPSIHDMSAPAQSFAIDISAKKNGSITTHLSPGRFALKNQEPPLLLRSPPSRADSNPTNSLLKSPSRITPTSSIGHLGMVRKSPRLLSKLIQSMDIKAEVADQNQKEALLNPFLEVNDHKLEAIPSSENKKHDTIISSSPQKLRSNTTTELVNKPNLSAGVPVLLPTGKTPRATRTISFVSSTEEEAFDENSLNLSNTVELFSPGFHGDSISHYHSNLNSSVIQSSQILTDTISDEYNGPSQLEIEFYQSEEYLDGISYVASLPLVSSLAPHPLHGLLPVLPPFSSEEEEKITLVLDLDETLVHCSDELMDPFDISFAISLPGRTQPLEVFVRWRPHLFSFLEELKRRSKFIDVVLFTASQKIYARRVLSMMDPDGSIFRHSLFRESCRFLDGSFVKDLGILGRPLSKTILVDNSIQAYGLHPENGYAIPSWFDDPLDDELPRLLAFLDHLISRTSAFNKHVDFRQIIRRRFPIYDSITALKENNHPASILAVKTLIQLTV